MYEGIRLATLNRGPGHWPGTAMPGELGNVVLAGHRTSHNAEFRHLDRLVAGDEVVMHTLAGRFVYHVSSTEIVRPDALWVVDQTPARTATLFACHPPGSVRERIVVHLELANAVTERVFERGHHQTQSSVTGAPTAAWNTSHDVRVHQ